MSVHCHLFEQWTISIKGTCLDPPLSSAALFSVSPSTNRWILSFVMYVLELLCCVLWVQSFVMWGWAEARGLMHAGTSPVAWRCIGGVGIGRWQILGLFLAHPWTHFYNYLFLLYVMPFPSSLEHWVVMLSYFVGVLQSLFDGCLWSVPWMSDFCRSSKWCVVWWLCPL